MSYKQNSPLPIPEGGTGISSYASGDIIYSSATDVLSKLNVGSNGNVLKLSSGVPVWGSAVVSGSGWDFISSATASSSANLNFSSGIDSTYSAYAFIINNIMPSSEDSFSLRTSTNGGSTYDSGASHYAWNSATFFDDNDNRIKISESGGAVSSTTGRGVNGILILYNPSSTYSTVTFHNSYIGSTGIFWRTDGTGRRKSSNDVNAVRFFMQSGNIASGTIYMYGMGTPS